MIRSIKKKAKSMVCGGMADVSFDGSRFTISYDMDLEEK